MNYLLIGGIAAVIVVLIVVCIYFYEKSSSIPTAQQQGGGSNLPPPGTGANGEAFNSNDFTKIDSTINQKDLQTLATNYNAIMKQLNFINVGGRLSKLVN